MDSRISEVLTKQNFQLLPIDHPTLSVYAQNVDGRPAIVVDIPGTLDRYIAGTQGVRVHTEVQDTQTYLRFESVATGITPMFVALVDSLLGASVTRSEGALAAMIDTFDEFKAMLAAQRGQLGESAIRGIFAELQLVLELREAGYTPAEALIAWQGPYRAAKDFILPGGKCVEVKSIRRQNHRIQISNLDQLNARGDDLRLAVLELDRRADGDGVRLDSLVNDVQTWSDEDPHAGRFMAQALAAVGLEVADPYYRQWSFEVGEWRWFAVVDGFPRVHPDVPAGVSDVRYRLDIDHLTDYATGPFWSASEQEQRSNG